MNFLPLLLLTNPILRPNAGEIATARAFLKLALPPQAASLRSDKKTPETDERFLAEGTRQYWFSFGSVVSLHVPSGHVVGYFGGPRDQARVYDEDHKAVPRKVDDAQATTLAKRFYAAAGWREFIRVTSVIDLAGANESDVEVRFVPYCGDVPYLVEGSAKFDRQTGQLDTLSISPPPDPPTMLEPLGTPEEGLLAAFHAGMAWLGTRLRADDAGPLRLYVWRGRPASVLTMRQPRAGTFTTKMAYQSYVPDEVAAALNNQGTLVYAGTLRTADGTPVYVRLDARTGHVLTMDLPTGGLGRLDKPKSNPTPVPTLRRPWRLGTGEAGWKSWTASVEDALTLVSDPVPSGVKVTLTDGKTALVASYDPKTNLLGIAGKTYRPGPALEDLLKRRTKG